MESQGGDGGGGGGLAQQQQQQQHQVEVVVAGGSTEKRRERKKGGSGGLVLGIAAVVVIGVAGKLLQRFNSRPEAPPSRAIVATAAPASDAEESLDKVIAGEKRSSDLLKKAVPPVAEVDTDDRGSPPIQPPSSVHEKFIGCETPVLVESKGRSFAGNAEISDQDSCSGDSSSSSSNSSSSSSSSASSSKAVIQVKLPLDKIVAAEEFEGQIISPKCQKGESDLAAQTALAELVHQSVRYDVPSDGIMKTKNLQDDIADVISRAFGDFGCGELAKQELAPTQVTFQVVWEEKTEAEDADVADTADSENPVHCDAQDNSEAFTSQSDSGSESESESANARNDFLDACDTDPALAGDEIEMEFLNAEAQMEEIRINPELSEPECENWPQATTSNELIISAPRSPSTEIEAQAPEDVAASAVSEALASLSTVPHSEEDFEPADHEYYFAREDSSPALDEAQEDAEDGVGECEALEESLEEAEGIVREAEIPARETLLDEVRRVAIARAKNLTVEVNSERPEDAEEGEGEEGAETESPTESLKQMEPAILERFEDLLCSSNAGTTSTPSSSVDAEDAETETDGVDEGEEGRVASTSDEELVVKITTQIFPAREEGCCEITAEIEEGAAEVSDQSSAEAAPESDDEESEEEESEDDTIVKMESSAVLASRIYSPNNATRGISSGSSSSSRGNLRTKSAVMTTMEFSSPSTRNGGNFKQESSRDRFPSEILRMAFLVALIAAIVLMLREHMKPLKHTS
ncbi:hypothetical protein MPTK1_3g13210 [Marchantia polymorpha subsp. ruderalis]|uniref:Uncharacterized protein n=2 Tax=Marchantia polymorpha TaxID=3197 RepID=A0A176W5D2_MARPO|nr:hypothetical protein AXG93_4492s1250 [Marchantia polymorpha subsp. ruderalis]PTQ38669.1 hypothetical protein MARPO_0050s0113 [Marchantia polymorpha]BBN05456.1 hypothetical protein Mp_3g13210 [Marchantia polymorpha subsp. ruderalis]|eukprot:PTQ38669.1 hypothetical protein MARPO_0050s0113 [Marchantia polymorpha]